MSGVKPISLAAVRVLKAIADGIPYGFDIMDATGLPSGTVYPILGRLERQELVRARWEAVSIARRDKRPPRRYYKATAAGVAVLNEQVARFRAVKPIRALAPGKVRG